MPSGDERDADRRGLDRDVTSEASRRAACLGLAYHALTLYEEAVGQPARLISHACGLPSRFTATVAAPTCSEDVVEEVTRSLRFVTGLRSAELKLHCVDGIGPHGLSAEELCSKAVTTFLRGYGDFIARLVGEPYEYFITVAWNGTALLGRGREDHITVPAAKLALFLHTHPRGNCIPSSKDVEFAAALLAEGGLASMIAGSGCVLVIAALRPLSEDDYWALMDASRRLRKVRSFEEAHAIIASLSRLRTVDVYVTGLTGL